MTITIQKPYFWKAVSSKEKDFFIGSLIKIHRKYAGRDPDLMGFTADEIRKLAGKEPSATPVPDRSGERAPPPDRTIPQPPQLQAAQRSRTPGAPNQSLQRPNPNPSGGDQAAASDYRRGPGPPPAPPPTEDRPPGSRDRYQSASSNHSASSDRPDSRRRPGPGAPPAQDPRTRIQGRNGSPAASTNSNDSYGGSTYLDGGRPSVASFDSQATRTETPPGRTSTDRQHPNGPSPLARNGAPGTPGIPPGPKSPERRAPSTLR